MTMMGRSLYRLCYFELDTERPGSSVAFSEGRRHSVEILVLCGTGWGLGVGGWGGGGD